MVKGRVRIKVRARVRVRIKVRARARVRVANQMKELITSPIGLPSSASMTSRTAASGLGGMSLRNGWKRSE